MERTGAAQDPPAGRPGGHDRGRRYRNRSRFGPLGGVQLPGGLTRVSRKGKTDIVESMNSGSIKAQMEG
jgi:hypothetical protein